MLLPVIIYWLLLVFIVSPVGNFPLNDDWIFSTAVKRFLSSGEIQLPWVSPSCNVHVILGGMVCLIPGFSHDVLRLLTLALAFLSTIVIFYIVKELNGNSRIALFSALCYAVNPILVNLSFSFMTDVPALAFANLFILFFLKWLRSGSFKHLIFASLALLLSIGVRQTNVIFIVPVLIVILIRALRAKQAIVLPVCLVVLIPVVWTVIMEKVMLSGSSNSDAFAWYKDELKLLVGALLKFSWEAWKNLFVSIGRGLIYDALLILPLISISLPMIFRFFKKKNVHTFLFSLFSLGFIGLTASSLIKKKHVMPFSPNIWSIPEIGPKSVFPVSANPESYLYVALTALCVAGAFIILWFLLELAIRVIYNLKKNWQIKNQTSFERSMKALFVFISLGVTFAVSVMQTMVLNLDRYYVFAIPCLIIAFSILLGQVKTSRIWWLGIPLLATVGIYSIVAMQDCMSLNRARWQLIDTIESSGVAFDSIDGGSEYNFIRDPDLTKFVVLKPHALYFSHIGTKPQSNYRWWPVNSLEYIVSKEPVDGYEVVQKEGYFSLLFMRNKYLYLNKINP